MRRITVISFLKTIFSYLADIFSHRTISVSEAIILRLTKKPYLMFRYLPVIVVFLLPGLSGMENTVYGQGCNPALTGCPGDIVVNVQPNTCGNNVTWLPPSMITPCPGNTVTSNFAPGDFFNAGTTQVIYYSWSGTEKKDSCKFNVIVVDNQKPVVVTKNANLYISQSGTAILNSSDINNGSSDNCSLTLIPGRTIFTCSDVGLTIPVALTGTDPSGNSSTSTAQVTVHDTTRPVINTREFSLLLDNNGTGSLSASDIDNGTYDNCGPVTLSVTPTSFSCPDQGSKKVTFTAADSHGNIAVKDVWITVNSSLKINSVSLSNCDAAGTYALFNSNVSGGSGSYFYFWDCLDDAVNPFVQEIAVYPYVTFVNTSTKITPFFNNNIPDGNYTIRLVITDGNGCSDTAEMIIVKTGPVYSNITRRSSTACEGSTVTYTVNPDPVATFDWQVTNGTILSSPPYTNSVNVQWNMGVTFGVVTATLSKTNLMGQPCSSTVTDSVSIDLLPPPVFSNPVLNACLGSEETYTVTVPYQAYEWIVTGGLVTGGGSGNNFVKVRWSPVPAGKVTVIVSTVTGCSASAYVDVNINNLAGSILSVTDITCNGAANGMVSAAAATGTGVAPYEYSLDGGAYQVSGNFVNIAPGPHFVRIRDAVLCTLDLGFNITQPLVLVASVNKVDVTCFGGFTGVITAAGSGGTSPYEYSLNSSAFQPSGAFSGLPAGLHTLNVRDANNCPFTQKIIILQPDAVSGSALVTTPVKCFGGTATVTITGSGGTAPLSYTFNGVTNSTGVFPGIPAGSSYSWSITDANSCGPFTGTLGVTQPAALTGSASVTTAILCNGGTGTVTLTGSGGTAPLSYTFNGVTNTTGIFNGIAAGAGYPWSITDANGCGPVTGTLPVTEPAIITGSAAVTVPVLCNGGTATVKLTGGGGTAPLSFTFNGVTNTTGIFSGIGAGTGYIWRITDANICTPATGSLDVPQPAVITGSASVTANILCHGGTVTVRLTGGGGTEPLSYTFNGVTNTTGVFTGIPAGTGYIWSITDANSCTPATGAIDVTEPAAMSGSASVKTAITCNGGTATVTITGSGGTPPLSYTFNGVTNSTGIFPGIPAGSSYSWSITDANSCGPFTGTLGVTEPAALTGSASITTAILCNGGTGTVTLTGSGGTTPLSYTFNGVTNTTGVFSGIAAGAGYAWSITDANGCGPVTGTLPVTEPAIITRSAAVTVPVLCNGGTATVKLTGGGGTAPLSYTFNGVTNTTGIFSGIASGTGYIWSITDANSCTPATGSLDVPQPAVITGSASVTAMILCHGGTATITLTGEGGTPPLSYTFNGATNTTGVFTGIPAGTGYIWSITDANSCTPATGAIDVNEPVAISGSAAVTTAITCNGGTATVTITGAGGTPPLSYTFNGVTNSTGIFPGIPAGSSYSWSITDANSCEPFTGTFGVTEPAVLTGSASVTTAILCNGGTGTVTLTGSGGTTPLSYTFNGVTNTTGVFSGISAGAGYAWSITDANGCGSVTGTLPVTEPAIITGSAAVTVPVLCNGGTATVSLTGGGGTAPLSYTFNGVTNTTGIFSGIAAGTGYIWNITDVNNCTPVTGTIDIGEPSAISGSASVSEEIICYGGTATVTITGSGSTAPLSYTFNGVTNATGIFPGITAGNAYSWSITDANNCGPLTGNIDVNQPDLLTAIAEVINPVPCPGGTATVKIIPSGGIAPYSFTFNGVTNATGIFSGIASGTGYVWSINDGNTCGPVVGTLDITEPLIITGTATVTNPVPCTGGTATVTITGSGGTEPYSFTFNGITNTSGIFSGISPGTGYQWIVNDINGCTPASGTLDITEPEIISGTISVTSPIVCNGSTTTVILTGNGGTIPLIYTFNGISNATGIFTEIHAGTAYQWSITDVNSCNPVTGIIDITEPPALTGTITFQSNVTVTGGNDGIVTVEGYGGTPPYLYSLNGSSFQVSGTFSSLTAGNYTVRIQDAALCEVDVPVSITDPSVPLSGTLVSKTDVSCFGGADGSLTVTGIAGIGTYEYSMNGTDFQASGTFNNLKAGTYIITIRDEKPATFPVTVDITEPETAVTVTTTGMNNLCSGDNTGSVIAVASGGTGPYEFSWNTSPVQMNDTASLLPAGTYEVTVTDANGCIAVGDVTISGPPALVLNLSATEADCPDTNDGSIILTISGGTAPYLTLWQDGNESQNRTELLPGNYTVTVTDDNGCAAMATAAVGFTGTFGCVEIPQIITPNNDGFNDEWRIRNIDLYPGAEVLVYTRWGKLVYKSRNISADPWDGRFNGRLMPTDSYHYILYLNDGSKPRSGVISIIR